MIIIDTRSSLEYQTQHAKGAINIPPEKFMAGLPVELSKTPKDEEIILYCRSGARSNTCGHILKTFGFTNITNGVNQGHVDKLLSSKRRLS